MQNTPTNNQRLMSKSPRETMNGIMATRRSMARIMQKKPAKAKAKRRTHRWAPRRSGKYRPYKHQAHKEAARTGPAAQSCDPLTAS